MSDLIERIDAAINRIKSGHGLMRVPVDQTDPDMVLADCEKEIKRLRAELAAIAAAPPYVVTDDDARVVLNAFWESSITDGVAAMRATLEAFVRRLGGES